MLCVLVNQGAVTEKVEAFWLFQPEKPKIWASIDWEIRFPT